MKQSPIVPSMKSFEAGVPSGAGASHSVRVDLQDQALVAGALGVGLEQVDDVPGHVAGLDLRADARQPVGRLVLVQDLDAGLLLEGLVIGLELRLGVGAAPGDDRNQVVGLGMRQCTESRHTASRGCRAK